VLLQILNFFFSVVCGWKTGPMNTISLRQGSNSGSTLWPTLDWSRPACVNVTVRILAYLRIRKWAASSSPAWWLVDAAMSPSGRADDKTAGHARQADGAILCSQVRLPLSFFTRGDSSAQATTGDVRAPDEFEMRQSVRDCRLSHASPPVTQ